MTNPTLLNICLLTFTTTKVMTVFQFLSFLFFLSLNCTAQSQYYYNGLDQTLEFRVYTNLHFAMREPELVYHIDLRNQRLTTFPEQLYKFPNLRSIILSDNNLQKIEIKPNTFQNVVMLDLANNKINKFSIGKNSLTFIKKLNLDNNQLILFPQLGNFNFIVEELYLRYNFIAHIPEGELFPSTLKFLYLDKNPIKNHNVIFREGKQLETLTLYHTGFKSFPEKGRLNKLTKLYLSDNPLDWSSFNPAHFPKLMHLDLSYIDLQSKDPFTQLNLLKNLRSISLEGASIKMIQPTIGNLKKLREITLLGNEINVLPDEFYGLKLKLINIQRNPLSSDTERRLRETFKKSNLSIDEL